MNEKYTPKNYPMSRKKNYPTTLIDAIYANGLFIMAHYEKLKIKPRPIVLIADPNYINGGRNNAVLRNNTNRVGHVARAQRMGVKVANVCRF